MERILRLAGLPTTTDPENLDFFCLREYSPSVRVEVIDYALRQNKGYGLVIIDGIRDLMLDINSTGESVEVINRMMEWSSRYDLHIHCVLHLNKGDNNVRGHIGTEMSNKAETVLVISKSNENPGIRLSVKSMPCISGKRSSSRLRSPSTRLGCPSLRKDTRSESPRSPRLGRGSRS